jgi:hypothetical protein
MPCTGCHARPHCLRCGTEWPCREALTEMLVDQSLQLAQSTIREETLVAQLTRATGDLARLEGELAVAQHHLRVLEDVAGDARAWVPAEEGGHG